MTRFDGKLVIVLDHLARRYGPDALPVSGVRDSRRGSGEIEQYDGGPPTLVSLNDYDAEPEGKVRLVDVRSGELVSAHLYRLRGRFGSDA